MNIVTVVNNILGRLENYVGNISASLMDSKGGVCPKFNTVYRSK